MFCISRIIFISINISVTVEANTEVLTMVRFVMTSDFRNSQSSGLKGLEPHNVEDLGRCLWCWSQNTRSSERVKGRGHVLNPLF